MGASHGKWFVDECELDGMSCTRAREMLAECFFHAQKESIARGKKALGFATTDEDIRGSVCTSLRMAFSELGADYDNPDRVSLIKAAGVLARKASAWGTPKDIIEHHKAQMEKIFQRLP